MPAINMHAASVALFTQQLKGLSNCLDKAQAYCEAKKIDPSALLTARLYPDMFHLIRQVQVASDTAKGAAARLAGMEVPTFADTEATFADLKARIAKTIDFIGSVPADKINGSEDRTITVQMRAGPVQYSGLSYLQTSAIPNFYFHVTTAYDILRHNGVEVGKRDYLGTR